MAGIGFELRKILKEDRLLSLAKVYGYSAILSSGPWVVSIIAILLPTQYWLATTLGTVSYPCLQTTETNLQPFQLQVTTVPEL